MGLISIVINVSRQNNSNAITYDADGNRQYYPLKNFVCVVNSSGTFDYIYYYDEKDLIGRKEAT